MAEPAQRESGFDFRSLGESRGWIDSYWEKGYAIIKGVFDKLEIERFARRFDRWYAEGMRHPSTFRHFNKVIWNTPNRSEDSSVGCNGRVMRTMSSTRCGPTRGCSRFSSRSSATT